MKKTLFFVLALCVIMIMITCKKKPKVETYTLEILQETVEVTTTTASITATYSFPTDIYDIKVMVSEYQNMSNAIRIPAILNNNSLNVVVEDLQMNTRYYYCYRYSNNVNIVDTDTRSFITLNASIPTITTLSITNITTVSATCEGNVTNDGGSDVTERGICWSKNNNPTIGNTHISNGSGTGTFTVELTDLLVNTKYYVKAYAKNSVGVAYGDEMSFTTLENATVPAVTTGEISNITQTSALASGNVSSSGGSDVTERGVCWSTNHNPTTSYSHESSGNGIGGFTVNLYGLSMNTTYYVRAYATNSVGTSYGNEVSFTTSQNISAPTVTTSSVSNITQNSASCGGNVTSEGGATVTARGVCWSTSQNPTTTHSHTTDGSGIGGFTSNMTGLNANTTYYIRAYSTNSAGTSYGNEVSFTTSQNITKPTLTTNDITNVSTNSATCGGNVTSAGYGTVTARGVCWSTSSNPTISNTQTTDGSGTGTFTSSITGLTANTTYYVRAYATNEAGTAYGSLKTFTTSTNITVPTVSTNNVTSVTATTATCGGNVTSAGNGTVTARGVCWSTSSNPTINNSHTTNGTGTGTFTSSITGLTPNTTYYVRAYATNSAGTAYGSQKTFTTQSGGGTAPTGAINGLFSVSATQQVYFSKGNLQYKASTNTWKFADNQYDYVGSNNSNISSTYSGWIDLFGWGTSGYNHGAVCYQPWSTSQTYSDYYAYGNASYDLNQQTGQADWGYNAISNGGNATDNWRTLTYTEVRYLFLYRNTTSGIRYAMAKVNGVNGLIVLPDNWSSNYYNLSDVNSQVASYTSNIISLSIWTNNLESHGAVFLPAAGYRGYQSAPTYIFLAGDWGGYWTATHDDNLGYFLGIQDYTFNPAQGMSRYVGLSVRLIQNAE